MFPRIPIAAFVLCAFAALRAQDAPRPGLLADGHLDTAALRDAYLQADIPLLRGVLEGFMKEHPPVVDRQERIFTHLYLGSVYAGETNGRAMALAHFQSLMRLDPAHDPSAMYLSPQSRAIFDEARASVVPPPAPASRAAVPASAGSPPAAPAAISATSRAWLWWTLGSAAAVGAGVGVYALVASGSDPGPRKVTVDGTLK